jgi:hypothetical protein
MSLFVRVLEALSGSKVDVDPHTWKLPSSYSTSKPRGKQTIIPNPRIFANAFVTNEPQPGNIETILVYPDISHIAVQLALLECF